MRELRMDRARCVREKEKWVMRGLLYLEGGGLLLYLVDILLHVSNHFCIANCNAVRFNCVAVNWDVQCMLKTHIVQNLYAHNAIH